MTDNEIIKAYDILSKFDLFGGQRAGRELWFDKPVDVQNEDIENFSKDVAFLKDFINRQQAEIDRYKGVIKILEKDVADARNEIESVNVYCENLEYSQSHLLNELATARKTAKAEAIKEFAKADLKGLSERLKRNGGKT